MIILVLLIFTSTYDFWHNDKTKYALFDIYAVLIILSSVTMLFSLWKMKSTI